ncbi:MgtC/SapB family protein [Microbispora sp. ATCC PTA-5024]|uniref:MgtC/SapB family protein n=1 Tax=Microbispora sp. ATCC PTA-5024 TaxID=316330 RepID=UPI0003DC56E1|nr:MgtC/SapB family protein [Microbispora sp. ATCC PTA-5024]ETK31869.1 mgtC family magnesium transporter [Microbispora sp. ATCC PTA-5024]
MVLASLGAGAGQGWAQAGDLAVALVLSAAIGLEREIRQKSAGLRTHILVGLGAALFMLVSKYGFADVLGDGASFDPSRVAAQIVSGIGFIGGGLIFVRRDAVKGLTTAAAVWLTAGVGMAAGAGLWMLAVLATGVHFLVMFGLTPLVARLPRSRFAPSRLRLTYLDGRGVLRHALDLCGSRGFTVSEMSLERPEEARGERTVTMCLSVHGRASVCDLTGDLADIEGMLAVACDEGDPQA